ncbi:hypothetical protein Thimo_0118 [Thioflavicoccus mobilis 8321]|uniref:Putative restriction endonuclease domain-containing protein n=1 Tax=Thioflavicoccus mobilis 8321 TaxID=765912 RepID=L0GQI5_9GAMM|nr:Uma2 family endonuclease [Thioflavicoccus mobilis]AGA88993.1 hypothetical protein Thimo_0118 [Thioflavicoccus mobilis 8321]
MSTQPQPYYSFEDYLTVEREARDEKHEYVAGQVLAMAGASYSHNLIVMNLATELRQRLKAGPYAVLASDMRLRIEAADACVYSDVAVLCDEPSFHDGCRDVLARATWVAEILSPSTEGYDRGGKFALYRRLPTPPPIRADRPGPARRRRLHPPGRRPLDPRRLYRSARGGPVRGGRLPGPSGRDLRQNHLRATAALTARR